MTSAHRWLLGVASMCLAASVFAQAAPAPPIVDESKLPEWVKRQARSPYKVIIESQAVKPKPPPLKDDETARRAVKKTATAAAPPEAVAADKARPASAVEAAARPAAEVPDRPNTTEPAAVATAPPTLAPVIEHALATARPLAPEPVAPPIVALPPEPTPLQLLDGGNPVIPADAFDSQSRAEVVVRFTVNPNGEISKLTVVSSSNARLNRSVLRAVQGWRYAPIASPREHNVSFAFSSQ